MKYKMKAADVQILAIQRLCI